MIKNPVGLYADVGCSESVDLPTAAGFSSNDSMLADWTKETPLYSYVLSSGQAMHIIWQDPNATYVRYALWYSNVPKTGEEPFASWPFLFS